MVSFLLSIVLAAIMLAVILWVGMHRQPGTPLTWGEAFVAGTWVFALMLLVYGIIPHHWLAWADNQLGWRPDIRGIPVGPFDSFINLALVLGAAFVLLIIPPLMQKKITIMKAGSVAGMFISILVLHLIFAKHIIHNHRLWSAPNDLSFFSFAGRDRGRVILHAQLLRDVIATVIYGIGLGGNMALWLWWQKRKPRDVSTETAPAVTESAFGRPVTQGT